MDGEQKQQARAVVAHLFQRSGRGALSESEMANALSLDLGWYAPKVARQLVAGLVRANLLQHTEDGDLEPVFDVQSHRVPLGFRPGPRLAQDLPPPGAGGQATSAGQDKPRAPPKSHESQPPAPEPQEPVNQSGATFDLAALLESFAADTGQELGAWVARMERVVQETGDLLVPEVALLLAASREGHDVSQAAASWRQRLEQSGAG